MRLPKLKTGWRPTLVYLLALAALGIVVASLWYSNTLVHRLRDREERLVKLWAESYKFIASSNNAETAFLVENLILKKPQPIEVPAILADTTGVPLQSNIALPPDLPDSLYGKYLQEQLHEMQQQLDFQPIKIEFIPGSFQYIYYRETDELRQLRYFPYVTLMLLGLFTGVIFINLYIAQRSRQNKLWVGLARETAHQLGTPISGILAWLQLLKDKAETDEDHLIADELEKDVRHLQIIADRFSKIGSEPELVPTELGPLLEHAIDYVRRRTSAKGSIQFRLVNPMKPGYQLPLSPILFEWVIENLLKNALDAMQGRTGTITVMVIPKGKQLLIEVEDEGKGMPRSLMKKVFNPGFTTKKRGWGLGLSLSRRIIENFHYGRIFVRKSEPDAGTVFRIILPTDLPPSAKKKGSARNSAAEPSV